MPDAMDEERIGMAVAKAAGFARDVLRLSWDQDAVDSSVIGEIALSWGLIDVRPPSAEEIAEGKFSDGQTVEEMTPEFSAVVDLLDAREASVAEAQETEPEFDLGARP